MCSFKNNRIVFLCLYCRCFVSNLSLNCGIVHQLLYLRYALFILNIYIKLLQCLVHGFPTRVYKLSISSCAIYYLISERFCSTGMWLEKYNNQYYNSCFALEEAYGNKSYVEGCAIEKSYFQYIILHSLCNGSQANPSIFLSALVGNFDVLPFSFFRRQ